MGEILSIPSDLAAFSDLSQSYKAIVADDTSAALLRESGTVMVLQYSLGLKVEDYRSSKGSYRQKVEAFGKISMQMESVCRQVMVLLEPHSSTSFGEALEYDVLSGPIHRAHPEGAQASEAPIILRSVDRKIDTMQSSP